MRVIAAVEAFFEEELGLVSPERAQSLSADQREALREEVRLALKPRPEDARPDGHVCPFAYRSYSQRVMVGAMAMKNGYVHLPRLEHLLLYFHSAAVFDTLAPALDGHQGQSGPALALRWLNEAAPLIRSGLLVLCDSRIEDRQAAEHRKALLDTASEFDEDEERHLWREMCAITGEDPRLDETPPERSWPYPELAPITRALAGLASEPHLLDVAIWDTRTALEAAMSAAGSQTDLWLADGAYLPVLAEVVGRADSDLRSVAVPPRSRLDAMTKLGSLALPAITRLSPRDLSAIRESEELFEDWRAALATALRDLPSSGRPSPSQLLTVNESLRESAARLSDRKRRLSQGLLTGEMRNFGIASVASATSGAIFGMEGLAAAVAASGAGSVLQASQRVAQMQKEKRRIESAQRHYTVFAPSS